MSTNNDFDFYSIKPTETTRSDDDSGEIKLIRAVIAQAYHDVGTSYLQTEDFKYYCSLLDVDPTLMAELIRKHDLNEGLR